MSEKRIDRPKFKNGDLVDAGGWRCVIDGDARMYEGEWWYTVAITNRNGRREDIQESFISIDPDDDDLNGASRQLRAKIKAELVGYLLSCETADAIEWFEADGYDDPEAMADMDFSELMLAMFG